jgi:hypothetical protein
MTVAATLRAGGDVAGARELHERAIERAGETHPYEQGCALDGIAASGVDSDPREAVRRQWALGVLARMNVPERHDVEKRLAELGRW